MSKVIITADSEEQKWLDSFNEWSGHNYKINQEVKVEDLDNLKADIYRFNNEIACGLAIYLTKLSD